ncbi:DUF6586 family protein [Pseudomonas sp. M30-35]|uniref:DUF6586 family protein n=1 Tax=Pseudomonas sp. M30-35 TaxID=1981174 RepID=UPI000B3CFF27|nr:DUF6586 family protein [Pseudomonas sp. M30-35]ARU89039.1 PasA protein [Pseudomonas sp. M30-35]
MANELYTRTNQKIFYAGLSLESWRKAQESQAMNVQGLVQAEREATLFHLYGAVLGLCHEIAGYYRLPNSQSPQIEVLLDSSMLEAAPSPEFSELVELAGHSETWLAQLLEAYKALHKPPQMQHKAKVDPTTPLIEAISIDPQPELLERETLEAWRKQITALARRFRESLSEW